MYFLNVHEDTDDEDSYRWIQTDARLYPQALELTWRLPTGAQAQVLLDLEYCEGESCRDQIALTSY
jgi:hypothetical protein